MVYMLYILFGIIAGNVLPTQTSINACLRKQVNNPLLVTLVSYIATILTFTAALLLTEGRLYFPLMRLAGQPFWVWLPGFLGVIFLAGNILLFPKLGGVKTVICTATGQVLMGLLVDHFALFGAAERIATLPRIAGAVLALCGVATAALAKQPEDGNEKLQLSDALWCIFGVLIGMDNAAQSAINAHVGVIMEHPMKATMVSSLEAIPWVLLTLLLTVKHAPIHFSGFRDAKPWMLLGGCFGGAYILSNAWLTPKIGASPTVISLLIGSTLGSSVIDHFGFFRAQKHPMTAIKLLGIVLILAGAVLIRML